MGAQHMPEIPADIDRRIIRSKVALKRSLLTLMQNKDFKDITITDIVRLAGLNRGTFYHHYQYKEELLQEIIDDVITDLIASYRDPYQNVEIFDLRNLTSSAIKIFDHVDKHSHFYTLIVKSNVLSGFQGRICHELKKLALQDLINCRPNPEINTDLYASYQAYAILGMIVDWVNSGFKYSSAYMAEQLLAFIQTKQANTVFKTNPPTPSKIN